MPGRRINSIQALISISFFEYLHQPVAALALVAVPVGCSPFESALSPHVQIERPNSVVSRLGRGRGHCRSARSPQPVLIQLRGGAPADVSFDDDDSLSVSSTKAARQPSKVQEHILPQHKTAPYPGASEHDGQIAALALPALLSLLVDPMLSLVDTAYVGRGLGAINLAALGPCTSIFHFSFNTFRSLTLSTTAMVSSSLAAGNREKAGQIVQQMYLIACVLGFGLQAILLTQAAPMLAVMGAGPGTALFPHACAYLKVRALAAPAVLLIMVSEGVFRGHSNTRAPAVAALSAAAANAVLDPMLMFTLSMGISGAAGATVCAQFFAVGIYGTMLWRGARQGTMEAPFLFSKETRRLRKAKAEKAAAKLAQGQGQGGEESSAAVNPWRLLVTVVSANVAMLIRTTSLMACWTVATAVAARMSSASVGAHQVGLSLWLLFALVAEAPSIAAQVLGSRYIGKGELAKARSMARRVIVLTLVSSVTLGAILFVLSGAIPRTFTTDPAVLSRLGGLLPLLALQQPLVAVTLVVEGLLVGAGQFRWLGATTACSSALSALVILTIGRRRPQWDVLGIWGGITAMFVGRLLTAVWRLLDRKHGPYWKDHPSGISDAVVVEGNIDR